MSSVPEKSADDDPPSPDVPALKDRPTAAKMLRARLTRTRTEVEALLSGAPRMPTADAPPLCTGCGIRSVGGSVSYALYRDDQGVTANRLLCWSCEKAAAAAKLSTELAKSGVEYQPHRCKICGEPVPGTSTTDAYARFRIIEASHGLCPECAGHERAQAAFDKQEMLRARAQANELRRRQDAIQAVLNNSDASEQPQPRAETITGPEPAPAIADLAFERALFSIYDEWLAERDDRDEILRFSSTYALERLSTYGITFTGRSTYKRHVDAMKARGVQFPPERRA